MEEEKLVQLYHWGSKKSTIDSQYGRIPYEKWLQLEKERICKNIYRTAEVREKDDGFVSLWVNDVVDYGQDFRSYRREGR